MVIFSIVLLVAGTVLAMAALAVRFAGNTPVLGGVKLSDVEDMAGLNRWAGNRLLILPCIALGFGVAGLSRPVLGIFGVGVLVVAGNVVLILLLVGSEKFRVAR